MRSLAAAALLLFSTAAAADTFSLDGKKSELVVKTFKEGFAAALAHNHVIKATEAKGELAWDPAAPEATKIAVTVNVAGLVADEFELRKKHGQTNEVSANDQRKVTQAMLGPDQLDAAKFPTISFTSSSVAKDASGAMVVTGKFTLHGVSREVKVPVNIQTKDNQIVGDGKLALRVSDYGIQPYSTALGSIKNKDQVELVLHLVAGKAAAPATAK